MPRSVPPFCCLTQTDQIATVASQTSYHETLSEAEADEVLNIRSRHCVSSVRYRVRWEPMTKIVER